MGVCALDDTMRSCAHLVMLSCVLVVTVMGSFAHLIENRFSGDAAPHTTEVGAAPRRHGACVIRARGISIDIHRQEKRLRYK